MRYVLQLGLLLGVILLGCANDSIRPSADALPRTPSYAIAASKSSLLKSALAPQVQAHPKQSGVALLPHGGDALELRIRMVQAAQHAVDLQYYIVEDDDTNQLFLRALLRAADRGVRVRLLVDSYQFDGGNPTWPLLNQHKNIELRIFNPFATRDQSLFARALNVVAGLGHYTRRMHNKIILVDNQIAITGGRNLGNPYFDASTDFNFQDLDVFAVGAIVPQLSRMFDRYWNDEEAFPLANVLPPERDPEMAKKLRATLEERWKAEAHEIDSPPLIAALRERRMPLVWAPVELAVDSPNKLDTPPGESESKPTARLVDIASDAKHEFIMVTPYFVPREEGVAWLSALVKKGVRVRILTNSLASTDAVAAHTGYTPYRDELLDAGVELYESKPFIKGGGGRGTTGSKASDAPRSLHTKAYMIDRKHVLIGSLNFDPRSIELNTELLLIIHSETLAKQVLKTFETAISPEESFHVIKQNGDTIWKTTEDGKEKHLTLEPAHLGLKAESLFFGLLPIEDQL